MSTRAVRDWLRRPSTFAAAGLVLIGCLFIAVEAQSPTHVYWTGQSVQGSNQGGIVFYRVHGEQYSLDDTDAVPPRPTPITVYYDPSDPSQALYDKPTRWIEAGAILVWFVAAAAFLVFSALRRRRRRRAAEHETDWISSYRSRADPH